MKVNITMLVRNRPNLTQQALVSLDKSWREQDNLTILDDRSDAETREIIDAFTGENCTVVSNGIPDGTGPLRNAVINASQLVWGRGDYLYLSDNDVCFLPNWLAILVDAYEMAWHSGFRVIGAYNHPFHQPIERYSIGYEQRAVCEVNALATQSMLMRWEVWDKYGPFCQTPVDRVCQSEDVDFTNRIRADGFKIGVVSPALIVSTGITNTFGEHIPGWELVKQQAPAGIIVE